MILINEACTYYDPDTDETICGIYFQDQPFTFRELVEYINRKGYIYCSTDPATGFCFEWLTTESDTNFRTGGVEQMNLSYSRKNKLRSDKYWRLAFKACGLIKE